MYIAVAATADGNVVLTPLAADGEQRGDLSTVPLAGFAALVASKEPERPRWLWDDTTSWYPALLAKGVRVDRCIDLRLCHTILRSSSLTAESELANAPLSGWDSPRVVPLAPTQAVVENTTALFDWADDFSEGNGSGPTNGSGGGSGLDPVREFRSQRAAIAGSTASSRLSLLMAAESVGALIAAEMRFVGLPWSIDIHNDLLTELLGPRPPAGTRPRKMTELLVLIRAALADPTANPDSPQDLVRSLRRAGIEVSSTRSWELKNIDHPVIAPLLTYKKLSRLLTANGWNWADSWVEGGRFRPTYIPGGVVTGRWASDGGGALQLPKQVRSAVRADAGWALVVADAAQLEPRVLAALSGDTAMAAAGRGRDLYDGIVASGAVDTRDHAKIGMLGAMYGGTTGESGRMLPRLARAYPDAIRFVEEAARAGERGDIVTTRLGRSSPRPGDAWLDVQDAGTGDAATVSSRQRARTEARSWGRFTRNFVVQGTAAEWALCWMAGLRRRLWELTGSERDDPSDAKTVPGEETTRMRQPGQLSAEIATLEQRPHLSFFLHDEVMVHTPIALANDVAVAIRESAAEAGTLIFGAAPVEFPVTVAIVDNYGAAK
jgi:DNA polymerase-1